MRVLGPDLRVSVMNLSNRLTTSWQTLEDLFSEGRNTGLRVFSIFTLLSPVFPKLKTLQFLFLKQCFAIFVALYAETSSNRLSMLSEFHSVC